MADRIRLLPEVVANQIAAGEVVNRPASVVKEMMENSIDAGATRVQVNFRDGGRDLIQIVDDGCGMSPIDARMAFDRHATSKIAAVEDIYALSTFGFRGEALASIAAVAQVELRTRQEGDDVGTCTEINGGQFVSQTPVMCPVGSQFYVRNLFYNVPARRRFLDKSTTSAAQIRTEFQRVALCNPHIGFELYSNDAPVYTLAASSLAGRIVDVVGRHIKQNLLEVEADTSIARAEGFIGRPAAAKRRNTEQYLFVNGRFFKSAYLTGAILKAYEKLIPENCTPSYFLYLTIDPSRIDVNVHPQKTEVKFADEDAVWQIVNAAVRETLAKTGAVPLMDFDREGGVEIPVLERGAVYSEPRAMSDESYNPFREEYVDPSAPEPDTDFTGFDVPSLATMYVFKPMKGHNLMQAIARVNRVYAGKAGGLVVDYIGLANALKRAMKDYTARDRKKYGDMDIASTAYPKFLEKLDVCRDLLFGFSYEDDVFTEDRTRLVTAIAEGTDWLLAPEHKEDCEQFLQQVQLMNQALSLCKSMVSERDNHEAAFFSVLRVQVLRITGRSRMKAKGTSYKEFNQRVTELLEQTVQAQGVINMIENDSV